MTNLQPTPIVDVNGIVTTRNKRVSDSAASSKRIQAVVSTPSLPEHHTSPLTAALTKSLGELREVGVYGVMINAHESAGADGTIAAYPDIEEIYDKNGTAMTVRTPYIPGAERLVITGYQSIVNESLLKIKDVDAFIELAELPDTDSHWVDESHFYIDISKLR